MWASLRRTITSSHFWSDIKAMHLFHLSRQGSLILVAVLLAKTQLSLEDIGTYELLLYGLYLLSFWWVVGFIQALLSQASGLSAEAQDANIIKVYQILLVLAVVLCGGAWVFQEQLLYLLTNRTHIPYWGLWMLIGAIHLPTALTENLLLLKSRTKQLYAYALWSGPAWVLAAILPVWLGGGLEEMLWGLLAVAILKHLYLAFELWRLAPGGDRTYRSIVILALPLVGYAVLAALNVSVDAWLVGYFYPSDEAQFAIYRYGAREFPLVMAMATAFSNAVLPLVGKNAEEGMAAIRQKSMRLFHSLFPLSILLLLTSHWWFTALFSSDFEASIPLFNTFLLIVSSRLIFTNTILIGLKKNYVILGITVVEVFINVLLSWWLFTRIGLIGLAVGTVIAYAFEKAAHMLHLYFWLRVPPQKYLSVGWWLLYSSMLVGAFLISGSL